MSRALHPAFSILLVDDEPQILDTEEAVLLAEGLNNVLRAGDGARALELLGRGGVGVVLLDLMMPGLRGEDLIPLIGRQWPEVPIIVVTGNSAVTTAVECMKRGAADFLVKPVELAVLTACVRRQVEIVELRRENRSLQKGLTAQALERPEAFSAIVTAGGSLLPVMKYVEAVAAGTRPVLITGETGVGKELFARALHDRSGRTGEFVAVNIAGMNEDLVSDSLFGHRRGAFTGADAEFAGLLERAEGGTLFLDEIGDLGQAVQVKLLRLLESGEYFPLGSTLARRCTARIAAATNSDLQCAVSSGRFRPDLFYRLSTHQIRIPPLRERTPDIPVLAAHFAAEAAREMGRDEPGLAPALLAALQAFPFPGNVRELRSMVFDAVARSGAPELLAADFGLADGQAAARPIGERPFASLPVLPSARALQALLIDEALRRADGNQTRAALSLGITQQAVSAHLKRRLGTAGSQAGL